MERGAGGEENRPARVFHADLWGTRNTKEQYLAERSCNTVEWTELHPRSPDYLFVSQDATLQQEYGLGVTLSDIIPLHGVGMTTARDAFVIDLERGPLIARAEAFRNSIQGDSELCAALGIPLKKGWNVAAAGSALRADGDLAQFVRPTLHRPFDQRLIFYHDALVWRTVRRVSRHMLSGDNLGLVTTRQTRDQFGAYATRHIITHKSLAAYDINSLFPLYLLPPAGRSAFTRDDRVENLLGDHAALGLAEDTRSALRRFILRAFPDPEYPRWPNLNPLLLAELETKLGLRFVFGRGLGQARERGVHEPRAQKATFTPEDVFNYIYAILYCPTYRTRYADFLKRDFPRIPFTSDKALFFALAEKGAELVALHLMESPLLSGVMPDFPERGTDTVERVKRDDNNDRVYINKSQYFANVPSDVWRFHVGGYQVCNKWLKDRKGRTLTFDDQQHYQRITVALRQTIRLMAEINALIPQWPLL